MAHTTFAASDPRQRTDLRIVDHDTYGLAFIIRSDGGTEVRADIADTEPLLDALSGPQACPDCEALERELDVVAKERDRARLDVTELRQQVRRLRAGGPPHAERVSDAHP